jgi:hypothetical protein
MKHNLPKNSKQVIQNPKEIEQEATERTENKRVFVGGPFFCFLCFLLFFFVLALITRPDAWRFPATALGQPFRML